MVFGVSRSNGAISGSIISKTAADGHLGMTALSRVTLAAAGLSCLVCENQGRSDGGIWGIYTLSKSVRVNFLWGNNDARTVIEHFIPPQNK